MSAQRDRPLLRPLLVALLLFGALSAFGGGSYGMAGARDVPLSLLEGSPFESFFWPSVILFFVVGGSMAAAAALVLATLPSARIAATAAGVILTGWILVQVAIIGALSWLQPAFAAVGVALIAIASLLPADTRVELRRAPPIGGIP